MWMLHGDKIRLSEGCELQNQIWAFLHPSLTKKALFLKIRLHFYSEPKRLDLFHINKVPTAWQAEKDSYRYFEWMHLVIRRK